MGIKRRAFLIGGAAVAGGGIFALQYGDYAGRRDALAITRTDKAGSFTGWLTIGEDGKVTLYTPHIDMGTGSATALAQMAADELDAAWDQILIEQAPVEPGFANAWLAKAFLTDPSLGSAKLAALPDSIFSALARNVTHQITGGSSAVRGTGQHGPQGATGLRHRVPSAAVPGGCGSPLRSGRACGPTGSRRRPLRDRRCRRR